MRAIAPIPIAALDMARPRSASRPAQPSSAPPPARIGVSPDQNASTATRPRIDSVSAVAPAASRCRPRGTTHPKTTAAATAMIAQTTRNSLLPCSSGPAQVPTAASTVASRDRPDRDRCDDTFRDGSAHVVTPLFVDSSSVGQRAPGCRRRRARSVVTLGGDLRVAPESDAFAARDWRTVRRMRALRLVRDHADLGLRGVLHGRDADRGLVRGLRDASSAALAAGLLATVPLAFRCILPARGLHRDLARDLRRSSTCRRASTTSR